MFKYIFIYLYVYIVTTLWHAPRRDTLKVYTLYFFIRISLTFVPFKICFSLLSLNI